MTPVGQTKSRIGRLSLARRILIGALVWSMVIVIGGVLATSAVYRAQSQNLLDADLDSVLVTLARAIEPLDDDSGRIRDIPEKLPSDARYETPLSGRYWVIIAVQEDGSLGADIRPRSVWDGEAPLPENLSQSALGQPGAVIRGNMAEGPAGEPIRIAVQSITIPLRDNPILLVAAADSTESNAGADQLRTILLLAMLALAGGTLIAMALGLRYALRPLDRIQSDITDVREGRMTALSGEYPEEVRPLSEELNKLLEHNRSVVSRARTHVGNLAHALKTPLAVLRNEATGDTQLDDVVQRQTEAMHSNVEHYLKRAQAAARAEALGVRTQVLETVEGLARVMNKLFAADGKSVLIDVLPEYYVRTERQDLEEILGNLLDNACKWARATVEVTAQSDDLGGLLIHIDDDGKGLTAEERAQAMKRGVRIDETAPGTGLGLSIVSDIAEMNGGSVELSDSPLGGLRASVRLRRG